MTSVQALSFRPIHWLDGRVRLLDQTRLPTDEVWLELSDYRGVVSAIKELRIRGAPAIGVAGAYAVALAAAEAAQGKQSDFGRRLELAAEQIGAARPTGANLQWAVRRMLGVARSAASPSEAVAELVEEAARIHDEDERANLSIGSLGAELLEAGSAVLTHCNAGALATGGYGTALGIVRAAWARGTITRVFATETRPVLQGARLTAWELLKEGIPTKLIADSAAGQLMHRGEVQAVVVGADRIAANGDVANKIGTYSLAVLARENGVSFYVAAPTSTLDMDLSSGEDIPIEERSPDEVTHVGTVRVAPEGVEGYNLAFDVTPARYVTAIITEAGVAYPPYRERLRRMVEGSGG